MKTLIILRHGKAEQDYIKDDFDRELTDRGRKNAADIGKFIAAHLLPELIISSSAKRTKQTAKLAAENLSYLKENIKYFDELYLVSASKIREVISGISPEIQSCMVVGHNPGMTSLVNYFGVRLDNLPTSGAVCFEFNAAEWKNIAPENAKFLWIQTPKEL